MVYWGDRFASLRADPTNIRLQCNPGALVTVARLQCANRAQKREGKNAGEKCVQNRTPSADASSASVTSMNRTLSSRTTRQKRLHGCLLFFHFIIFLLSSIISSSQARSTADCVCTDPSSGVAAISNADSGGRSGQNGAQFRSGEWMGNLP